MSELWKVRVRLTAWYVGLFALILVAFGAALLGVLTSQISRSLDRDLRRAADTAIGDIREAELRGDSDLRRLFSPGGFAEPLRTPGRTLYVFDGGGALVSPDSAESWIRDLAVMAIRDSAVVREIEFPNEDRWRAFARSFASTRGGTGVVVVRADTVEVEDQYSSLFLAFLLSGVVALVLVGIAGWFVAGRYLEPVRDSIQRMRDFMADAAHELRTPVAAIEGNAEVALRTPRDDAEYREFLGTIHAEASRLGGILENLLTIARADASAWPFRPQSIFLDDLLLEVAQNVQSMARRRGIEVKVLHFDALPVRGDPDLLRRLLMILLDNSLKYGRFGGSIGVSARRRGNRAAIVVEDDGPGIDAEVLPRVFDRFYRGERASSETGTGLGLSIARWITDAHDARIAIESEPERGTRVTVDFPLEEDSAV
ncbi:MAG: HAMP domain-containing sensor histidine kinase [bacterium]